MDTKKTIPQAPTFIFDFDGTIADTFELNIQIYNQLADKYNFKKVPLDKLSELRQLSGHEIIKMSGIPLWRIPFLLAEGQKEFGKHTKDLKFCPHLKTILTKLKNKKTDGKFNIGIVSSNSVENIQSFLKKENLEIFDFIYSEKSLFGKDKVLKKVIKKYQLDPNQTIYIGDETRDIIAAQKVKLKVAAVTWGFCDPKTLRKENPNWIINHPQELLELK